MKKRPVGLRRLNFSLAWILNRCAIGDHFGRFWGPFSTSKKKHCFKNCFASFWKIVFPKFAFWDPKFENCFAKLLCKIVLNNFPKNLKKCFAGLMFSEKIWKIVFSPKMIISKNWKILFSQTMLALEGFLLPFSTMTGELLPLLKVVNQDIPSPLPA